MVHNGVTAPVDLVDGKFEEPTVIYFGRVKRLKRIDELLRIFKLVQRNVCNVRFLIVGRGEKKYLDSLKKLSKELNLANGNSSVKLIPMRKRTTYQNRGFMQSLLLKKVGGFRF